MLIAYNVKRISFQRLGTHNVIIKQGFKYKLKINEQVESTCRLFAGHRRRVYNYFVEMS